MICVLGVLGVVLMAGAAQAALLSADTVDPMVDTSLMASTPASGFGFADYYYIYSASSDPFAADTIALTRTESSNQDFSYKTASGYAFDSVSVFYATHQVDCVAVSATLNGVAVTMPTATVTTAEGGGGWTLMTVTYDFSAAQPDTVTLTLYDPWGYRSYTPLVGSASLSVVAVPEPVTLALLAAGGMIAMRRRG
jgi:hypothetical protein